MAAVTLQTLNDGVTAVMVDGRIVAFVEPGDHKLVSVRVGTGARLINWREQHGVVECTVELSDLP